MQITKITKRVSVVTGKYDSVVITPFGRFTVDSHEAGIQAAQAYVAQSK